MTKDLNGETADEILAPREDIEMSVLELMGVTNEILVLKMDITICTIDWRDPRTNPVRSCLPQAMGSHLELDITCKMN